MSFDFVPDPDIIKEEVKRSKQLEEYAKAKMKEMYWKTVLRNLGDPFVAPNIQIQQHGQNQYPMVQQPPLPVFPMTAQQPKDETLEELKRAAIEAAKTKIYLKTLSDAGSNVNITDIISSIVASLIQQGVEPEKAVEYVKNLDKETLLKLAALGQPGIQMVASGIQSGKDPVTLALELVDKINQMADKIAEQRLQMQQVEYAEPQETSSQENFILEYLKKVEDELKKTKEEYYKLLVEFEKTKLESEKKVLEEKLEATKSRLDELEKEYKKIKEELSKPKVIVKEGEGEVSLQAEKETLSAYLTRLKEELQALKELQEMIKGFSLEERPQEKPENVVTKKDLEYIIQNAVSEALKKGYDKGYKEGQKSAIADALKGFLEKYGKDILDIIKDVVIKKKEPIEAVKEKVKKKIEEEAEKEVEELETIPEE